MATRTRRTVSTALGCLDAAEPNGDPSRPPRVVASPTLRDEGAPQFPERIPSRVHIDVCAFRPARPEVRAADHFGESRRQRRAPRRPWWARRAQLDDLRSDVSRTSPIDVRLDSSRIIRKAGKCELACQPHPRPALHDHEPRREGPACGVAYSMAGNDRRRVQAHPVCERVTRVIGGCGRGGHRADHQQEHRSEDEEGSSHRRSIRRAVHRTLATGSTRLQIAGPDRCEGRGTLRRRAGGAGRRER